MNKSAIIVFGLAAAFLEVSCYKEDVPCDNNASPIVIKALAEGVGNTTKAEMAYKYDVLWNEDDEICVMHESESAVFTLTGGAGTSLGTFEGTASFDGEVEAFYPASIVSGNSLIWPEVQQNNQVPPMYCRNSISGQTGNFSFSSLGAMLQIIFNTTVENAVLESIEIKDGSKTMSGAFTVDGNGQAEITADTGAGVLLNLGAGIPVGFSPKFFYISIPAGKYEDLSIVFTLNDGSFCTMHSSTFPEVKRNTVGRLTLTAEKFEEPSADLKGKFSIAEGVKVVFSPGNLQATCNGTGYDWGFAAHQYERIYNTYDGSALVGQVAGDVTDLFGWSTDATYYGLNTSKDNATYSGNFKDWGEIFGDDLGWRTLSYEEWEYLIGSSPERKGKYRLEVNVCGLKNCLVIAPDDFTGSIAESYDEVSWRSAERKGLVCLPPTGFRNGTEVMGNNYGHYWTSSSNGDTDACCMDFHNVSDGLSLSFSRRCLGFGVRLVHGFSVSSISLDQLLLEICIHQRVTLKASVKPVFAPKDFVWTSNNTDVATVSEDGTVCGVSAGFASITVSTPDGSKSASCIVAVDPTIAGDFSVDETTKVRFSQGNLYHDGSDFRFETNQYDLPPANATSHKGLFYWSKDVSVAIATRYDETGTDESDILFTNSTATTANPDFTVAGSIYPGYKGMFRAMSQPEWAYLLFTRANASDLRRTGVTINGVVNCLVIAPDDFTGTIESSYDAAGWEEAESAGLVCLPATITLPDGAIFGRYWDSNADKPYDGPHAYELEFTKTKVFRSTSTNRKELKAIRLVYTLPE